MTDREKIREEVERLFNHVKDSNFESDSGAFYYLKDLLEFIDSLQKEPVDEHLNIESMIESYEQRLLSQVNGAKNNPLVDMCLVSYKHGINEILDTLNLSNLVRIGKNKKESKFKVGDRIKFKGVRNEYVTRVITNIQKGDEGGFLYLFADGSIYSIDDDGIELVEESVSEDLGEYINELSKQFPDVSFAKLSRIAVRVAKWQKEQFEKNRLEHCNNITNDQAELEQGFIDQHLDKYNRMPTFLDAIEYGMRLQKEQMMKNVVLETEVLRDSDGDGVETPYESWLTLANTEISELPESLGLEEGDKVKVIIVKED